MTRYLNPTTIEWTRGRDGRQGYSWNPIVGCLNGCKYCYANVMCNRFAKPWGLDPDDPFKPKLYRDRLDAPERLRRPSKIFLESMGELWGNWVPFSWKYEVMRVVEAVPRHTFLNLTKSPEGIHQWQYKSTNYIRTLPDNLWVGVSVDTPDAVGRLTELRENVGHLKKFVSFEPLIGDVSSHPDFSLDDIKWVIIGAQTGAGAKQPDMLWYSKLIWQAVKAHIPIFIKDNLEMPEAWTYKKTQDFPEGMI